MAVSTIPLLVGGVGVGVSTRTRVKTAFESAGWLLNASGWMMI